VKKCPYCAEDIQNDAIKCKHCGELLVQKPATRHCQSCGTENNPDAFRCKNDDCAEFLTTNTATPKAGIARQGGQPTKPKSSLGRLLKIVFGMIFALLFISIIATKDDPANVYARSVSDQKFAAWYYAQQHVKASLSSPSTAKFGDMTETIFTDLGNGKWRVSAYVDAQNMFGATLRKYYDADMQSSSDNKSAEVINITMR